MHNLAVLLGYLLWPEFESQLGDLAGKVEWHLVIVVVHRCPGVNRFAVGVDGEPANQAPRLVLALK